MNAAVLDYSEYENECDPASDALIVGVLERLGVPAQVVCLHRGWRPSPPSERVWLRYDLRCPEDLAWMAECALRLRLCGVRVYPSPEALLLSEDKWLTDGALRRCGLPLPPTCLADRMDSLSGRLILKPRVGWGGDNTYVIDGPDDPAGRHAQNDAFIAQPFIPNERTLIAAVADGRPIVCIEDRTRTVGFSCRAGTVPFPSQAADLAWRAVQAVGLSAGTVDLLETPQGLCILEVNSAPRLTYPDLPDVDLALPMAQAVIKEWNDAQ